MKKNYLLMAILVMALTLAGCANDKNDTVSDTNVNNEVVDDKEVENDVKEEVSDDKQDEDEAEAESGMKIDYITVSLEDIINPENIFYTNCVDNVIDSLEFKVPNDNANFRLVIDGCKEFTDGALYKTTLLFDAGIYSVYCDDDPGAAYYVLVNTSTNYIVRFSYSFSNYFDTAARDKIKTTFNEALEEYLNSK